MNQQSGLKRHLRILLLKGLVDEALSLGSGKTFLELVAETGLQLVHEGSEQTGKHLLQSAVARHPDNPLLLHALGTAISTGGAYDVALRYHQQAVRLAPDEPAYRYNLAFALEKCGRREEVEEQYRMAWEQAPEYDKAVIAYARLLTARQRFCHAVAVLRKALRIFPESSPLLPALANALIFAGEPERALLYYRIAFEQATDDRKTIANFLYSLLMVLTIAPRIVAEELDSWAGIPLLLRSVATVARQLDPLDARQVYGYHLAAGQRIEAANQDEYRYEPKQPERAQRLRIGYLSSDLYNHPMGYLMQGVLPNHDRSCFEVFVFSPFDERDSLTTLLRQAAEHWIVLDPSDRERSAALVRSAGLDLLIELSGHTGDNWLDICARRLAPVQLTWGGYPATTGIAAIDYILADQVSLPPEDLPFYSEKPLRLSRGYACFIPPAGAPDPAALPALQNGFLTFGCFFSIHKLNSATYALWGRLLRTLPEARLFLKARAFDDPEVVEAVLTRFEQEGICRSRICAEGGSPRLEMLDEYRRVDIALDPLPYQGGVTILEAAWMGVPTLLKRGNRPPFIRHGENYLVQMGLEDWIAATEEAYLSTAAAWSRDLPGLAGLRNSLRQQMAASPICDTAGFTRDLEAALQRA